MNGTAPVDTKRYLLDLAEIYDLFQKVNASQIQIAIMMAQSSVQPEAEIKKLIGMMNDITGHLDKQIEDLKTRVSTIGVKIDN